MNKWQRNNYNKTLISMQQSAYRNNTYDYITHLYKLVLSLFDTYKYKYNFSKACLVLFKTINYEYLL